MYTLISIHVFYMYISVNMYLLYVEEVEQILCMYTPVYMFLSFSLECSEVLRDHCSYQSLFLGFVGEYGAVLSRGW